MALTRQKIARDRQNVFNIGAEQFIGEHVPAHEQDEFRTILKTAADGAIEVKKVLNGDNERQANQVKTAFAEIGVAVEGDTMSRAQDRKQAIAAAVKEDGLSARKIANDRQNVWEMGFDTFVEQSGLNDDEATAFRKVAADGIEELNNHPEVVQEFLKA